LSDVLLDIRVHITSFVLVRCIIRDTDTYKGQMMLYVSVSLIIHLTRTNDVICIRMFHDISDKDKWCYMYPYRHTNTYNIICPCQMYYYTCGYIEHHLSLSDVLLEIRIHITSFVLVRYIMKHTDNKWCYMYPYV
jgi:hypothetical protein